MTVPSIHSHVNQIQQALITKFHHSINIYGFQLNAQHWLKQEEIYGKHSIIKQNMLNPDTGRLIANSLTESTKNKHKCDQNRMEQKKKKRKNGKKLEKICWLIKTIHIWNGLPIKNVWHSMLSILVSFGILAKLQNTTFSHRQWFLMFRIWTNFFLHTRWILLSFVSTNYNTLLSIRSTRLEKNTVQKLNG